MSRSRSIRRWLLTAMLTAPLFLGTCAEMAIRVSINSAFDAVDPYLIDAAEQALGVTGNAGTQP